MLQIAVITKAKSDFSVCLEKICKVTYMEPDAVSEEILEAVDGICVLGGTEKNPLVFLPDARHALESQIAKGKKVFCEYVGSIRNSYTVRARDSRFLRLVYVGENPALYGRLMDDQCNTFTPSVYPEPGALPIMVYREHPGSHAKMELAETPEDTINYALWKNGENLIICNFRLCNFIKARFSPYKKWQTVVGELLFWLTGKAAVFEESYSFLPEKTELLSTAKTGISWFHDADMLVRDGRDGVLEGLTTEITPDGHQRVAESVRADCAGEAALAFYTDYLLTKNEKSLQISDNLADFCFEKMQIQEGPHRGMIRWTTKAWGVCYQDDVARILVSVFLKMFYSGDKRHLEHGRMALDFLLRTTGTDGLRVKRTSTHMLTDAEMQRLTETPSGFYSAHHNAYYMAALFMFGTLSGETDYIKKGEKGLAKLMEVYPETIREHSETQELCRLILPLAWRFYCTKDKCHKEELYRVARDLEKTAHKSGAFLEYDTGYKAARSRKIGDECSLLMENGDPVCDLLYSVNWLPMAFSQAYFITGDAYFENLWKRVSLFFARSQIQSENPKIRGAWARCFDVEEWDIYGTPNDVDWGPWCIESGWTVSNIISGIGQGLLAETLMNKYE